MYYTTDHLTYTPPQEIELNSCYPNETSLAHAPNIKPHKIAKNCWTRNKKHK